MGAFIELQNVTKRFGASTIVDNVSLELTKGEVFSLLGPSGCGKTTLLRILGGFLTPDSGRVLVDGQDLTDVPPNRRPINTVFQNYALFPHLSVRQNIAFGLTVAKRPAAEIAREVERMLDLIQLREHADKKPGQISGGQKQRVAIARALINKPQLLLLDEPLAALDLKLRQRMLIELDNIHDEVGITFLYVTHDQGEAMSLSDRVAVMNKGRFEQLGSPAQIYEAPRSRFVAQFIGDTNLIPATVVANDAAEYFVLSTDRLGAVRHRIGEAASSTGPRLLAWKDRELPNGTAVVLCLRPEKIAIGRQPPPETPGHNAVPGVVEDMIYLGSRTQYRVRVGAETVTVWRQHNRFLLDTKPITWKENVWLSWHADDGYLIDEGGGAVATNGSAGAEGESL